MICRLAQILCVSLFLSFQVDETVSHPQLVATCRTLRYLNRLAVDNQKEARSQWPTMARLA